jgi:predicted  nucleic acid-binding Zn-ribbon protein
MCKEAITKLEDQQLEFMEQAEQIAKETAAANTLAQSQKRDVDKQIADLAALEGSLKKQIAEDESTRATLGAVVDPSVLSRYERLLKSKGENVVVGIDHGVCGGCHMRLNTQTVRTVQGETDITNCPHCGRILYYTREMELAVVD